MNYRNKQNRIKDYQVKSSFSPSNIPMNTKYLIGFIDNYEDKRMLSSCKLSDCMNSSCNSHSFSQSWLDRVFNNNKLYSKIGANQCYQHSRKSGVSSTFCPTHDNVLFSMFESKPFIISNTEHQTRLLFRLIASLNTSILEHEVSLEYAADYKMNTDIYKTMIDDNRRSDIFQYIQLQLEDDIGEDYYDRFTFETIIIEVKTGSEVFAFTPIVSRDEVDFLYTYNLNNIQYITLARSKRQSINYYGSKLIKAIKLSNNNEVLNDLNSKQVNRILDFLIIYSSIFIGMDKVTIDRNDTFILPRRNISNGMSFTRLFNNIINGIRYNKYDENTINVVNDDGSFYYSLKYAENYEVINGVEKYTFKSHSLDDDTIYKHTIIVMIKYRENDSYSTDAIGITVKREKVFNIIGN